jgi:hypothetical protein
VARPLARPGLASVAAAVLVAWASPARADDRTDAGLLDFAREANVTGSLRANYFQSSTSLDDRSHFAGLTLQAKALPQLSDAVSAKVEARLIAPDSRFRRGYRADAQLLEGYLAFNFGTLEVRLGKQNVAWGRTDGINPTDNLTPRNYQILLPNDEDQRFGTWSARAVGALPGGMTLTLFLSPDFTPHKVPVPAGGHAIDLQKPAHRLSNAMAGIKLDRSSDGLDWSISYFHGPSLLPTARSFGSTIRLGYDRTDVLGFDIARNFGKFGFRSELAYTFGVKSRSADPNASKGRLYWVAGFDRTFGDNLNVNVQGLLRWMPGRVDPAGVADSSARGASLLNSAIYGQERGISPGMTFRVSNLWRHDTLRAELFGIVNAPRGDFYLRPLASYDVSDKLRISAGANIFAGPSATQYGAQKKNAGAILEVRRGF